MKRITALASALGSLLFTTTTLAAIDIGITPPASGINPGTSVGRILSNALMIVFTVAALVVLFMLIIGAFQWIMSGGDKDAVGNARKRITHALIGLAILALAFLIVNVVGQIVGINVLNITTLPTLEETPITPTPTR